MSIELPKYTILQDSDKPKRISTPKLLGVFFIGCIAGFILNNIYAGKEGSSLRSSVVLQEETINKNKVIIAQHETEISLLQTNKKVKQQAIIQLQQDYNKLLSKNSALNSDIKFYENLLSPNLKKKGLRVFESKIKQLNDNNFFLKVSVVQKIEKAQEISGSYKISLKGKIADKTKTIQLSNSDSKYKFKYFQNISLEFLVPKSFNPEQLVVELFPKNKKAKPIKYTVDWLIEKK